MSEDTRSLFAFTALRGHAIGVGDPDAANPVTAPMSLLCAVTFSPIHVDDWCAILQEKEELRDAVADVLRAYGGIEVLRPSNLHMGPLAYFLPAGSVGEC